MPLRIKKAGGFERGSNDKTASVKITWYAMRYQDNVKLWQPADSSMEKIKNLIAQRDRIINAVTQLTVPVNELKDCGCEAEAKQMEKIQKTALAAMKKRQKTLYEKQPDLQIIITVNGMFCTCKYRAKV